MQVTTAPTQTNVPPNLLEHNVQMAIHLQGYTRTKDIRIVANGTTVTLMGEVESFFVKQLAQEVSKNVPGVEQIVNQIEVMSD